MAQNNTLVRILLVEDNVDDIMITKKALLEAQMVNPLDVVRDGQEAVEFLSRQGRYHDLATSPTPGLILLDINLPKMSGLEVLTHIKRHPNLKRIPVIMLTSSERDEDVVTGYEHGCNSFLQKPVQFDRFVALVKEIGFYWGLLNVNAPGVEAK